VLGQFSREHFLLNPVVVVKAGHDQNGISLSMSAALDEAGALCRRGCCDW
jgi:hypothetical protein